jgi:hypothetical protein
MVFFWLILAFRRFAWLFRPPTERDIARIYPNAPCPICGARQGKLRCVVLQGPGPQSKELPERTLKVMAQHSCECCGGRWFEQPVVNVKATDILPSVARDQLEEREDRAQLLQGQK